MNAIISIPLAFCTVTPHYFILSFHQNYLDLSPGNNLYYFWLLAVILFGFAVSSILVKHIFGTFLVLTLGIIIFGMSSITLYLSLCSTLSLHYKDIILVACFGIGLTQPNMAALIGDHHKNTIQFYFVYVLINMIGMGWSSYTQFQFKYLNRDVVCDEMICYQTIYLWCMILSCVAILLLIPVFCLRSLFTIRPLLQHEPWDKLDAGRIYCFRSITIPLLFLTLVIFFMERLLSMQTTQLILTYETNVVPGPYLNMIYTITPIVCIPFAMLFAIKRTNGFIKITIGGVLIIVAGLYLDELHSYAKQFYYSPKVIESNYIEYQAINGCRDCVVRYENENIILPVFEKLGPRRVTSDLTSEEVEVSYLNERGSSQSISFDLSWDGHQNNSGQLVTLYLLCFKAQPVVERTYRTPSGFHLVRFLADSSNQYQHLCVNNSIFNICNMSDTIILEIPPGMYDITFYNGTLLSTWYFDFGGYHIFCVNEESLIQYLVSPIKEFPSFNVNVIFHLIAYVLISLAKVMIYAGGLDVSYQIGTTNRKSLFITWLYTWYIIGWIASWVCYDVYQLFSFDDIEFVALFATFITLSIYGGQYTYGYLLNPKE